MGIGEDHAALVDDDSGARPLVLCNADDCWRYGASHADDRRFILGDGVRRRIDAAVADLLNGDCGCRFVGDERRNDSSSGTVQSDSDCDADREGGDGGDALRGHGRVSEDVRQTPGTHDLYALPSLAAIGPAASPLSADRRRRISQPSFPIPGRAPLRARLFLPTATNEQPDALSSRSKTVVDRCPRECDPGCCVAQVSGATVGAAVGAAATAKQGPPNTLTSAERAGGWRLLFDGTTTKGWRGYKSQAVPNGWRAENGTLTKDGSVGDIMTADQFAQLRARARLEDREGR